MRGIRELRTLLHVVLLALMFASSVLADDETRAQNGISLVAAIGEPGSASFALGTVLWALGEIDLRPGRKIAVETVVVAKSSDRLTLLRERRADLAFVVDLELINDEVPAPAADHVRAVMAFWPKGVPSIDTEPVQLLVHADVPENVVYDMTSMIFEQPNFFRHTHISYGVMSPRDALIGLDVPIHAGALRYYQEEIASRGTALPKAANQIDSTSLKRQKPEALPSEKQYDDPVVSRQVAAACRLMAVQGALVHFRGHPLVRDCVKLGAIQFNRRRQPTM
ncbi:MAG: TAXI family TRAP transporter solute-binding subunit [Geminicoccaceae bacterium]